MAAAALTEHVRMMDTAGVLLLLLVKQCLLTAPEAALFDFLLSDDDEGKAGDEGPELDEDESEAAGST